MSSTRVLLPVTGPYTSKDQTKSDKANKFIGRGSDRSSTNKYRIAWGDRANAGTYVKEDTVFVSVEGARGGRLTPDFTELDKAIAAGVTFITDDSKSRERPYNSGEREVATYLAKKGYTEQSPGTWKVG